MKKICLVVGTRPEIIKMAPIIRIFEKNNIDYFVLHTGQHYNYEMDEKFFEELELTRPKYNIEAGNLEYRKQMGRMIKNIQKIYSKEKVTHAIVEGDTNSVLAGALAANKLGICLIHLEAGLRSHDLTMPEEKNRIITDHISDIFFAPTKDSFNNLLEEYVEKDKIYLTGNTVVDAVYQNIKLAQKTSNILKEFNLEKNNYILITAHRPENVDNINRFSKILEGFDAVSKLDNHDLIYPIHPRSLINLKKFGIERPKKVRFIDPVGYLDFLNLIANSKLIITDSGGVQEEACTMGVPCVTIRDNTERPEAIRCGANVLVGVDPEKIRLYSQKMMSNKKSWENPFGNGKSAEKILSIINKL